MAAEAAQSATSSLSLVWRLLHAMGIPVMELPTGKFGSRPDTRHRNQLGEDIKPLLVEQKQQQPTVASFFRSPPSFPPPFLLDSSSSNRRQKPVLDLFCAGEPEKIGPCWPLWVLGGFWRWRRRSRRRSRRTLPWISCRGSSTASIRILLGVCPRFSIDFSPSFLLVPICA